MTPLRTKRSIREALEASDLSHANKGGLEILRSLFETYFNLLKDLQIWIKKLKSEEKPKISAYRQ